MGLRKTAGKSRMIRGILRTAHFRRLGFDDSRMISTCLDICARRFLSLVVRAAGC
jgi:hypothetical protein